ncbi:hypothetical protein BZA77DRAFT_242078 [Pyronema omphalodes]|nr:hypothetical protein BZA77DRAFT_242078 [Pyronema omphalodes]
MCIRITELYAVCKCTYHIHGVDPCQSVGQHNHTIQNKTVLVGYACGHHSGPQGGVNGVNGINGLGGIVPKIGILPDSFGSACGSYQ